MQNTQPSRLSLLHGISQKPDLSWPLVFSVFLRNLKVFSKTWVATIMFNFVEPLLYLWAMGFGLGVYVTQIQGLSYLDFLAPGLIASSAMFATTYEMTYGSFTRMGHQKVFHGMVATPVSMDDVLMGEILYGTFKGLLYGFVFFTVVVLFGIAKSPLALLAIIPLFFMSAVFSIISLVWTAIAPNYDSFGYFFTLFISPMFLFAGIFFPIDNLPPAIQFLPAMTPLYHAVEVIRPLILGKVYWGMLIHLAWLVALTLVTIRLPLVMVKNKLIK
ncbi:ABC transporter permease [Paradesulfitobacterium ferrireducens]|uniref:ABC transporter permease n=1 Tax=Paradesulfitobacterium ferrireducens TaxID=2816476 RepID=UPI001A8FC01D|nr:ABC transporter permease [Paradesulfitobacterium ferrireducens]